MDYGLNGTIVGVDVGKTKWGWCVLSPSGEEKSGSNFTVSYQTFYHQLAAILSVCKPEIVVCGKPNRYYDVISSHFSYIGVVRLLCEKINAAEVEMNDSTARATLFPKKGGKKEGVQPFFLPLTDPDRIDAIILARAWKKLQQG